MDAEFWRLKWETNDIAFHNSEVNPLLVRNFDLLGLPKGGRVFLPLCGKTLDIHWLLACGYRVVGAELCESAVEQLFNELKMDPQQTRIGASVRYSANDIDVFVGDIFDLDGGVLGSVDATYDRAALVALPETTRRRYTAHVAEITNGASQLLICVNYDQSQMEGPPFSIDDKEVMRHYAENYRLSLVDRVPIPGGLKGKCPATETVWLLAK